LIIESTIELGREALRAVIAGLGSHRKNVPCEGGGTE
jgi:hypothetical protein